MEVGVDPGTFTHPAIPYPRPYNVSNGLTAILWQLGYDSLQFVYQVGVVRFQYVDTVVVAIRRVWRVVHAYRIAVFIVVATGNVTCTHGEAGT